MPKGILLAGGKGTRLQPATFIQNKHLLNIINEPMVLFPLRTLKTLGIQDILLVAGGNHVGGFADFLGDGGKYDVNLTYKVQTEAGGIAQALGLAKDFVHNDSMIVILADNIYDNNALTHAIARHEKDVLKQWKSTLFLKKVSDP